MLYNGKLQLHLYHGSHHKITDLIEPHISFDGKPLVYATHDLAYALVRAGKFNPDKFTIKEDYQGDNKPFRLVELYPGAFEDTFNCSGYIYLVDFEHFVTNGHNEFVSPTPVPIKKVITIENVWECITSIRNYELIYYEDSEPYWQTVRGGKAGYLKRREERAAALKEKQTNETKNN